MTMSRSMSCSNEKDAEIARLVAEVDLLKSQIEAKDKQLSELQRPIDPDSEGLTRAREDPLVAVLASMITGPPDRAKTGGYSVMWGGLWTRTLTQKDLP